MKKILVLLIATVLLGCKSENETPKEAVSVAENYKIAYNVLLDGEEDNYEVFSMNLDGSDKRNISNLKFQQQEYEENTKRYGF